MNLKVDRWDADQIQWIRKVMDPSLSKEDYLEVLEGYCKFMNSDFTYQHQDLSSNNLKSLFLRRFYGAIGPLRDYYPAQMILGMIDSYLLNLDWHRALWFDMRLLPFLNPALPLETFLDSEEIENITGIESEGNGHAELCNVVIRFNPNASSWMADEPNKLIERTFFAERSQILNDLRERLTIEDLDDLQSERRRKLGLFRMDPVMRARILENPRLLDEAWIDAFSKSPFALLQKFAEILNNSVEDLYALRDRKYFGTEVHSLDGDPKSWSSQGDIAELLLGYFEQIEKEQIGSAIDTTVNLLNEVYIDVFNKTNSEITAIYAARILINRFAIHLGGNPPPSIYDELI